MKYGGAVHAAPVEHEACVAPVAVTSVQVVPGTLLQSIRVCRSRFVRQFCATVPTHFVSAFVQVVLGPPEAVQAGASWRLQGDASYATPYTSTYTRAITANGAGIEFKPIPGWDSPGSRTVGVSAGTMNIISDVFYTYHPAALINPRLLEDRGLALTLEGITNRVYAILSSSNLLEPMTNWAEVLRLTNTASQTMFTNPPPANTPSYYRAKEL